MRGVGWASGGGGDETVVGEGRRAVKGSGGSAETLVGGGREEKGLKSATRKEQEEREGWDRDARQIDERQVARWEMSERPAVVRHRSEGARDHRPAKIRTRSAGQQPARDDLPPSLFPMRDSH